jgi:NitT/TauT family transport system ATP-binding protein
VKNGQPFIHLDRVSLIYQGRENETHALDHTTIDVHSGEFIAVVGPSGCGKSSLLKLVSGLHPATSGKVVVAGQEVTGPLKISGMAFQNATLLPWRRTIDNVLLPLEIVEPHARHFRANRGKYEAMANDLLALVGLAGFERKYPWELSGGVQQRSSLCRALIANAVAGRAVRGARRVHARGSVGRAAKALAQQEADGDPGHSRPA